MPLRHIGLHGKVRRFRASNKHDLLAVAVGKPLMYVYHLKAYTELIFVVLFSYFLIALFYLA